jgi:fibronectin type 3 domain-containing protein
VAAGVTYTFEVQAYNAGGSATSNAAGAALVTPAAPSNLTATAVSASQINLSWTSNSAGAEQGFRIYKSTDGVTFNFSDSVGPGVTSYQATSGLSAGTTYYWEVRSYNAAGMSDYSNVASATTLALPAAPSNLTVTVPSSGGANQINLSWTSNSGGSEQGFRIYKSTDGGVTYNFSDSVGTGVTSYSATSLSASTTYWFKVRSYNAAGLSDYSNAASGTTLAGPAAPSNLTATVPATGGATEIDLSWTSNTGGSEQGFKIYKSTDGVTFNFSASVGSGVTSYAANFGLSSSTTYWFKVRAYDASGTSDYSNVASATTLALPAAPSNLTATAVSAFQINLSWTSNSGGSEQGFKIYKSTDGGVTFNFSAAVGPGVTSYSSTSLTASTTYYYWVRSYNAAGTSVPSNTAGATTMTLPAAPTNLTATAVKSSGKSTLTWTDNSSNPEETGFKIYKSTDKVTFTFSASVGQDVTSYTATGLSTSTVYYFEVRSYILNVGASAPSNWAGTDGTTGAPPNPNPVPAEIAAEDYAEPENITTLPTVGWSAILGQSATVNVYVDDPDGALTAEEYARIADALAALSATTGLTVVEVSDPLQANIIVENSTSGQLGGEPQGVLGDAEMSYAATDQFDNSGLYLQITDQVLVNVMAGWDWYTGSDVAGIGPNQYDYETVALHELGHAVGLMHDTATYDTLNSDGHSVMYPALGAGQVRRQFSPYDVSWLDHLYAGGTNPGGTGDAPTTTDLLYAARYLPAGERAASAPSTSAPLGGPSGGTRPEPTAAVPGQDTRVVFTGVAGGSGAAAVTSATLPGSSDSPSRPVPTAVVNGQDLATLLTALLSGDAGRAPGATAVAVAPSLVGTGLVVRVPQGAAPAALLTHIEAGKGDRLDPLPALEGASEEAPPARDSGVTPALPERAPETEQGPEGRSVSAFRARPCDVYFAAVGAGVLPGSPADGKAPPATEGADANAASATALVLGLGGLWAGRSEEARERGRRLLGR